MDRRPAAIVRCPRPELHALRPRTLARTRRRRSRGQAQSCRTWRSTTAVIVSAMRRARKSMLRRGRPGRRRIDVARLRRGDAGVRPGHAGASSADRRVWLRSGRHRSTSPQHGLTAKTSLVELVTPDGSVVLAGRRRTELPGPPRSGATSVSQRLDFRLHPVDRVVGGVTERGDSVRDVLRAFRDVVARSRAPQLQAVIPDESLAPAVLVAPCVTGPGGPHRWAARSPLGCHGRCASRRSLRHSCRLALRRNRHYWKGHFVHELSDDLIDELARTVEFGRPPSSSNPSGRRRTRTASVGARVSRSRVQRARWRSGGLERRRATSSGRGARRRPSSPVVRRRLRQLHAGR